MVARMVICMNPTSKQLQELHAKIAASKDAKGFSHAEIGRISNVHPSQVDRICDGGFRTFSHNVLQICKVLDVDLPRLEATTTEVDPAWEQAQTSIRTLWDETPVEALTSARMLNALQL